MSTETIREAVVKAGDYLRQHPQEARYIDSAATATLEQQLRCLVEGPDGARLVTDMVSAVGGGESAPSPGWLFRAALASCEATLIAMRAAQLGIRLTVLRVTVDSESDDRGLLGVAEDVPAGPLSMRVRVHLGSDGVGERQLREVVRWAHAHCPVSDAVQRAVPVTVEIENVPG